MTRPCQFCAPHERQGAARERRRIRAKQREALRQLRRRLGGMCNEMAQRHRRRHSKRAAEGEGPVKYEGQCTERWLGWKRKFHWSDDERTWCFGLAQHQALAYAAGWRAWGGPK